MLHQAHLKKQAAFTTLSLIMTQ